MKSNVGTLDRSPRIAVDLILIALRLATGTFRYCPAYPLPGIDTCTRTA